MAQTPHKVTVIEIDKKAKEIKTLQAVYQGEAKDYHYFLALPSTGDLIVLDKSWFKILKIQFQVYRLKSALNPYASAATIFVEHLKHINDKTSMWDLFNAE